MPTVTQSSYANVASTAPTPSKDQAIILDSIEGCTIDDYLDGIEKITELSNVRFISKISGNRVCIYLNSSDLVNKLVSKKVVVNQNVLSIRPYMEKNKRVVISNVSPYIPHHVIINSLASKGISIVSQMYHIKASSSKAGRAHIMSFRRQVYIKEEDEHLLPESLQVIHDETTHWIFLSTESANCFLCKQHGHIAKVCPSGLDATQNKIPPQPLLSTIETGLKRQASSSTTESLEHQNQNIDEIPQKVPNRRNALEKPEAKKSKPNSESATGSGTADNFTVTAETLDAVKSALESRNSTSTKKLPLDLDKFAQFLNDTYGKTKVVEIAASFTDDTEGLLEMLNLSYPIISEKSLKARIARIKKKIRKSLTLASESDSDV